MLPTMLYDVLEVILGHLEKRSDVINVGLVVGRIQRPLRFTSLT
jgi:hypothetical protein